MLRFSQKYTIIALILVLIFGLAGVANASILEISGDPLTLKAHPDGTMEAHRWQGEDLVNQYYSHDAWGSVLVLNGTSDTPLKYASDYHSGTIPNFTPVTNEMPNDWTIRTKFGAGDTGVEITQTITYTNGNAYYRKSWEIANNGTETFTDVRFLHGGDTYFAGDDDSQGHWNESLGMVYLTNPDPLLTGIMGFYGSLATPADQYYEAYYGDVNDAMQAGNLPNTVDNSDEDAGYALQWNRTSLAPGETWVIVSFEKWTTAGLVQVLAPADQVGTPGQTIAYSFAVTNEQDTEETLNLSAVSSSGWSATISGESSRTIAAGSSATVTINLQIPSDAIDGDTDELTLTATSATDESVANSDTVTTLVMGMSRVTLPEPPVISYITPHLPPVVPKTFPDLVDHWSKTEVEFVASRDIVLGFPNGTFQPDRLVTRAEFAAILLRTMEYAGLTAPEENSVTFSDVDSNAWYADAVLTAAEAELILGLPDGTFRPDDYITHEEMAAITVRLLLYLNVNLPEWSDHVLVSFPDAENISSWARESMKQAVAFNLVRTNDSGELQPQMSTTRAEAALAIARMIQVAGLR